MKKLITLMTALIFSLATSVAAIANDAPIGPPMSSDSDRFTLDPATIAYILEGNMYTVETEEDVTLTYFPHDRIEKDMIEQDRGITAFRDRYSLVYLPSVEWHLFETGYAENITTSLYYVGLTHSDSNPGPISFAVRSSSYDNGGYAYRYDVPAGLGVFVLVNAKPYTVYVSPCTGYPLDFMTFIRSHLKQVFYSF